MPLTHSIYRFSEVDGDDSSQVGLKGGMLGELIRAGFVIPDGFIVSSSAYFTFLKENQLITKINHLLQTINYAEPHSLMQVASHIQKLIKQSPIHEDLSEEIFRSYRFLGGTLTDPTVVLRSSITSVALPSLTLAGERDGFISVTGESTLVTTIKSLWASLFDARSLYYRHEKKYDAFHVGLAVIVQNMIESDISGSLFSVDVATHTTDSFIVEAIYGIKEPQTAELIPADRYVIDKKNGEVTAVTVQDQPLARERVRGQMHTVRLPETLAHKRKLTESHLQQLAELGQRMERHHYFPFELSWAIKGSNMYVLSVKQMTPHPVEEQVELPVPGLTAPGDGRGTAHTQGIATGHVRVIESEKDFAKIISGEIILLKKLEEAWIPLLKRAYGFIVQSPITSPSLIQCVKELGLPCISGIPVSGMDYRDGSVITINANTGEITPGGQLTTESQKKHSTSPLTSQATATKVYLMVDTTTHAERAAELKSDGVGLLQGDTFIQSLGTHPKKIVKEEKQHSYQTELAEKLETVCRAFFPRPVIYKLSDLLSSDYKKLHGGSSLEPTEMNPLLGYRGGYRLIHDHDSFRLELMAIKEARVNRAMTNLHLMIPFLRSTHELKQIQKILHEQSFTKSPSFKLWMSIDTPENVIAIDSYIAENIQGLAINTSSLATLFLGIDPSNSEVLASSNEENDAVLQGINFVLRRAQKHNLPTILYGKSVAHSHLLIEKAITGGISGIVTTPDALENVRKTVYKYERKMVK